MKDLFTWLREHTLVRFGMVGGMGFCTETVLLLIGIKLIGLGPIVARVPSFTAAVFVTWYFNRKFTFKMTEKTFLESFPHYISANFVGMLMNFGIYSAAILWLPNSLGKYPIVALAAGALVSLVFNFTISRYFIFKPADEADSGS